MIEVGLFDGSFEGVSVSAGKENQDIEMSFSWAREKVRHTTVFTDLHLHRVMDYADDIKKVAMLVEPPSISDTHYIKAFMMQDKFDYILTFNRDYIHKGSQISQRGKWLYYPLGGSWIALDKWGIKPKHKMLSMFVSEKRRALGHNLRLDIQRRRDLYGIDVFGRGYNYVESKTEGLTDYRYSVVVESIRTPGYFSEKLIDCISQGTIPIYWGDPEIYEHFNMDGIIPFNNTDDLLEIIVSTLSHKDYDKRRIAAEQNLVLAREYACAENWIFANYPFLFSET